MSIFIDYLLVSLHITKIVKMDKIKKEGFKNRKNILPIVGIVSFDENGIGEVEAGKGSILADMFEEIELISESEDEKPKMVVEPKKEVEVKNVEIPKEEVKEKGFLGGLFDKKDKNIEVKEETLSTTTTVELSDEAKKLIDQIKEAQKGELVQLAKMYSQGNKTPETEWNTLNKEPLREFLISKIAK